MISECFFDIPIDQGREGGRGEERKGGRREGGRREKVGREERREKGGGRKGERREKVGREGGERKKGERREGERMNVNVMQVCPPALLITLGVFFRLFTLLEDACHALDLEMAESAMTDNLVP